MMPTNRRKTAKLVPSPAAVFLLLVAGISSPLAHAQFFQRTRIHEFPGEVNVGDRGSKTAEKLLGNVRDFVAAGQWDEAVERLRQVMQTHGDALYAIPNPAAEEAAWRGMRFVTVRDYCHMQIAQLPEEALDLYRSRVDPRAQQWLDEGKQTRNKLLLRRIADHLFCSSYGDDALLLLGELALERGHFDAARRYLEQISPRFRQPDGAPLWNLSVAGSPEEVWQKLEPMIGDGRVSTAWRSYPDTDLPLADIRARLVLVSILQGARERAAWELKLFRRLHPEAEGRLAGRTTVYAEALARMLDESESWPDPPQPAGWHTFAGSPRRNKTARGYPPLRGLVWDPIDLGEPIRARYAAGQFRIGEDADSLLSYHPVVADDLLLIAGERRIRAFDLRTGKPAWDTGRGKEDAPPGTFFEIERQDYGIRDYRSRPQFGAARFTLTVHGGKLYARIGDPVTNRGGEDTLAPRINYLVCLDLRAQGRQVWKIRPDASKTDVDEAWSFEGTPLADDRHVYVALRRGGVSPQAYVACYDAQTGRRIWLRKICDSPKPVPGTADEVTHNLLTLAEDAIYYNTNLGAVAALRKDDGAVRWVHVYQRETKLDLFQMAGHRFRDLTPCLYHEGTIVAAPQDSRYLLGLDAAHGVPLWRSVPCDAVHLLGVAGGRLIASGRGLYWFDMLGGSVQWVWPEGTLLASSTRRTGLQGWGRGVVAGGDVLWPVRRNEPSRPHQVLFFSARTGQQSREPLELSLHGAEAGNLMVADEHLLIASATKLYAFGPQPQKSKPEPPELTETEPREAIQVADSAKP